MKIKQIIALVIVVALLMTGSVLVTFAYLTRSESVLNTFTVGDITMKLDETAVDVYGNQATDDEGNELPRTQDGNKYKLIPGHTYTKDPMVTIGANSEPCYVRMLVTVTDYADLCAVLGDGNMAGEVFLLENVIAGWDSSLWACETVTVRGEAEEKIAIYEFRYTATVDTRDAAAKELEPLFAEFSISNDVLADDLADLAEMQIQIEAQAIQTDAFTDAQAAWDTLPY